MIKSRTLDLLLGKTFKSVRRTGEDQVLFEGSDGDLVRMYHDQDCCESVDLQDVCGDLQDLVGAPILQAEEISFTQDDARDAHSALVTFLSGKTGDDDPYNEPSCTWTFYKLSTIKGGVTLRRYGVSNGYYSEEVTVESVSEYHED